MDVKLYSIAFSHPSRAAGLMLNHKGIQHERVDLPVGSQQVALRALGFRHGTVPALKIDDRRVQGTRKISRALDETEPAPPLFPADPEKRAAVEEAEHWGDRTYQPVPRRIFRWAVTSDPDLRALIAQTAGLPAPAVAKHAFWPVSQVYLRFEGGGRSAAEADVGALPGHLDHVDELIAKGVIGSPELNAADFQIGTTTRVLLNFPQIRPLIEGRPAAEHAMRVAPRFGGEVPVVVPHDWVPSPTR